MHSKKLKLSTGDVLFKAGDQPNSAYLLESGFMEVSAIQDGEKIILGTLRNGDILGEMAVIDNNPRTATVLATTDCVLLEIDKEQFAERLLRSDPIVRSLLDGLIRRYRGALASMSGTKEAVTKHVQTTVLKKVTVEKIRLETQLKEALDNHALDLRFQPLLDLQHDMLVGYEALVRWDHPERGFISPAEFIALAEETNLIAEVGEYVVEEACGAIRQLIDAGASPHPFVSVNISVKQLNQVDLITRVAQCVKDHGLKAGSLKLEITESQSATNSDIKTMLDVCHKHKIKVALDDFGTGYSNLTQLHELDFDTIKIDQAFTRGFDNNARSLILVDSIVDMCHALGADVLIEGIETQEMLDLATKLNCKYAQGYFIGKPEKLDVLLSKF